MTTTQPARPQAAVRSRAIWMDVVRGLAIIAVIYGHTEAVGRVETVFASSDWMLVSNQVLVLIRMPLLMFLSGMLVPRSLAKGWRSFLPGKFTKLAWPYAVWIALFFVILWIYRDQSLSVIPMNILWPEDPNQTALWYLRNLFFYYLIAQALAWLRLPLWSGAALGVGISAAQLIADVDTGTTELRFANLMTYFFLGAVAMKHREAITRVCRRPLIALTLLAMFVVTAYLYVSGTPVRYRLEFIWGPLAFIGLVLAFAPSITSSAWTKPLEFIGRNSLYFYVMHFHLFLIYSWSISSHLDIGAAGHFLLMMAIGLIIPALTVHLANLVPPIKWLFFELPWPRRKKAAAI
ncbi:acyltransferase family protein [Flaviflexus salsibiostraticola]|uniref:acyltransferase family protein n=1 Tax=Flaviflexus salsibiostraticola TaxID=1282737 RepID=UPI0013DE750C|nr:acyltransferase [Flaviflexus salsibiostraticola]